MELTALSIILAAIVLEVLGQVALKRGAALVADDGGALRYWTRMLREPWVLAGIAFYGLELTFWVAALRLASLSIAFPLMALSYAGVAIAGHYWLGERLGRQGRFAIMLITAGAVLITLPPN